METPAANLSRSERLMLNALAQRHEHEIAFDWLALQRLKSFRRGHAAGAQDHRSGHAGYCERRSAALAHAPNGPGGPSDS